MSARAVFWRVYLAGLVLAAVWLASGCATPAPAAGLAPAPGLVCDLAGEPHRVLAPMASSAGWWSIAHTEGRAGAWFAAAVDLKGCRHA